MSEDAALAVKSVRQTLVVRSRQSESKAKRIGGKTGANGEEDRAGESRRHKPIQQGDLSSIQISSPSPAKTTPSSKDEVVSHLVEPILLEGVSRSC